MGSDGNRTARHPAGVGFPNSKIGRSSSSIGTAPATSRSKPTGYLAPWSHMTPCKIASPRQAPGKMAPLRSEAALPKKTSASHDPCYDILLATLLLRSDVMDKNLTEFRLDKTALSIAALSDASDEKAYWLSRSPHERLLALEWMRQTIFGYDPVSDRLQRVLTITELK